MTTVLEALVDFHHPECGLNTCVIRAALRSGYPLVAADALVNGEPGCLPDIELELEKFSNRVGQQEYELEVDTQRQEFLKDCPSRTCPRCRSEIYTPDPCGSCGKEVP